MRGDPDAARRRLDALMVLVELPMTQKAEGLAQVLMERKAVPKEFPDDALHIAMAAVYGMDYLVSWNFKHITNMQMIPKIRKVCIDNGYLCPEICTPYELQETGGAE